MRPVTFVCNVPYSVDGQEVAAIVDERVEGVSRHCELHFIIRFEALHVCLACLDPTHCDSVILLDCLAPSSPSPDEDSSSQGPDGHSFLV